MELLDSLLSIQEKMIPWYESWFDENYLALYHYRDRDDAEKQVRLIIDTLELPLNISILDLACGEGRYTALFDELGYHITGLDLSETLIQSGKEKYPDLDLRTGDMRHIPGVFDLILSLFTSFGYFETDEENEKVLHSVYHALKPKGFFWLDFFNAKYVQSHLTPQNMLQLTPEIEVLEKKKIENGRIIKDICFKKNGQEQNYRESVRLFTHDQLADISAS
ncbi:MAG: class I SAM-dependent methyltransferase [Acidobacteria bacterium]|nr:class I SAM-dependent methyltransferase [Acidobacteriota bacterium]